MLSSHWCSSWHAPELCCAKMVDISLASGRTINKAAGMLGLQTLLPFLGLGWQTLPFWGLAVRFPLLLAFQKALQTCLASNSTHCVRVLGVQYRKNILSHTVHSETTSNTALPLDTC